MMRALRLIGRHASVLAAVASPLCIARPSPVASRERAGPDLLRDPPGTAAAWARRPHIAWRSWPSPVVSLMPAHCMDHDAQLRWEKHHKQWQSKFSWLELRDSGLGCASCFANGSRESIWSNFKVVSASAARPAGFNDHEKSAEHNGLHRAVAPSLSDFKAALHAVRRGQNSLHDAGRHKLQKMKFCLGEGIRQSNLNSLKQCHTSSPF